MLYLGQVNPVIRVLGLANLLSFGHVHDYLGYDGSDSLVHVQVIQIYNRDPDTVGFDTACPSVSTLLTGSHPSLALS